MKKTLILMLIFGLLASQAYAEGERQESSSEKSPSQTSTVESSTDTPIVTPVGTLPTPDSGISGSVMPFLQESFQTDLATGAATMSIPITVPPGRKNMQPNLALSYSSNNSNGLCGVGWAIPTNLIQRSTKDGVPKYDNTDTFIFISSGSNAELVDIGGGEYRAKIEGAFMKYIYNGASWTVYDKSGTKYTFGEDTTGTGIVPTLENSGNIFAWYLSRVEDTHGNYLTYIYNKPGDGQIYLKEIHYTGGTDLSPDKEVIFNYDNRSDKLYTFRNGWEIVTTKRLASIYVNLGGSLLWRYELAYTASPDTDRSLLTSITVYDKGNNSLPPKTFTYQRLD